MNFLHCIGLNTLPTNAERSHPPIFCLPTALTPSDSAALAPFVSTAFSAPSRLPRRLHHVSVGGRGVFRRRHRRVPHRLPPQGISQSHHGTHLGHPLLHVPAHRQGQCQAEEGEVWKKKERERESARERESERARARESERARERERESVESRTLQCVGDLGAIGCLQDVLDLRFF